MHFREGHLCGSKRCAVQSGRVQLSAVGAMSAVQFRMNSVQCILHSVLCTVNIVQLKVYN